MISRNRIFLVLIAMYLMCGFMLSSYFQYAFFVDSNNYKDGVYYAPVLSELLLLYPYSIFLLALFNIYIVFNLIRQHGISIYSIFLLMPYNLLLITNATKEAIIFIGCWAVIGFAKKKGVKSLVSLFSSLALFLPRPIYLLMLSPIISRKLLILASLLFLTIFIYFNDETIKLIHNVYVQTLAFLESRSRVDHVGRDFFNLLCVREKNDIFEFFSCSILVFLNVPLHEDIISTNYLIFLSFNLPFFLMICAALKSGNKTIVFAGFITIFLYFAVFYASPTAGAFIRYFHPVIWLLGWYLIFSSIERRRKITVKIV